VRSPRSSSTSSPTSSGAASSQRPSVVPKKPNGDALISPRLIQVVGLGLLVASAVFWAVTNRQSVPMIGASLTLIGVGSYNRAVNGVKNVINSSERGGESGVRQGVEE
jgi:hypothetical protein